MNNIITIKNMGHLPFYSSSENVVNQINISQRQVMDNYKTRVRNSFDSKAKYYDKFAKIQKLVAQRMIERLEIINITPKRILDLGCGTGILARLLKEKYKSCNVVSVDLSLRMLKICKENSIFLTLLRYRRFAFKKK